MIEVGRNCLECSRPIDEFRDDSAEYCCEACRQRARYRRKGKKRTLRRTLESARKRKDKRCRRCNADISWRPGQAIFCSKKCREVTYSIQKRRHKLRKCRDCQQPILFPNQLCDHCRPASKIRQKQRKRERQKAIRQGWLGWDNQAATIEEKLRRKSLMKEWRQRRESRRKAANEIYRELMGIEKSVQPQSILPPPFCVVCGIFITGHRKRNLCSRACSEERGRQRASARYYEVILPKTARMIATADLSTNKGAGKFRDRHRYRDRRDRRHRMRTERHRERDRQRWHVYRAMKELNLVQQED